MRIVILPPVLSASQPMAFDGGPIVSQNGNPTPLFTTHIFTLFCYTLMACFSFALHAPLFVFSLVFYS